MENPPVHALITLREHDLPYFPTHDFRQLGGKALWKIALDKLQSVPEIGHIYVITDSDTIRQACTGNAKLTAIAYPNAFSDDENEKCRQQLPTSDHITAHALEQAQGEHFLHVHCANPFLAAATISDAIHRYYNMVLSPENEGPYRFDSLLSLQRIEKRLYSNEDYPVSTLRDSLPFVIVEDTVLNIFSRTHFNSSGHKKFGTNPMFYEVREIEQLSVETDDSFALAEVVYENRKRFPHIHQG